MASSTRNVSPGTSAPPGVRIPGLDGLRAIAVALVIFDHLCQSGLLPFYSFYKSFIDLGNIGVRVFFVISGFIITDLLIREQEKHNAISLRAFYIRRCFRILPLLLAFVTVIFILRSLLYRIPPFSDLLAIATFTVDYVKVKTMDYGHLWSLSVEEQFYLIWPFIFAMCSRRTARQVVVGTILLTPVIRTIEARMGAGYMPLIEQFQNSCDALAIGCGLALIRRSLEVNFAWKLLAKYHLVLLLSALMFTGACLSLKYGFLFWQIGDSLYNVSIVAVVAYCIGHPHSAIGYVLNNTAVRWLGSISYGLYLWQQPLTFHQSSHVSWLGHPAVNIMVLTATAASTYYLIEEPARNIGRRLAGRLVD